MLVGINEIGVPASTDYQRPSQDYACNKNSLYGQGGNYGFRVAAGTLDYFTNASHRFYTGTTTGTGYGTARMSLLTTGLDIVNYLSVCSSITASGAED